MKHLRYAFIDTETTGLASDARIAEAAVTHLDPGQLPRVAFCARVNPEIPMEKGASMVTGITDDDLRDAPPWVEIGPKFMAAIGDRVIVAYNYPYDFKRINFDNERCGLPLLTWGTGIDPLVLIKTKALDQYQKGKKLWQACARRGIAVDAHGAAGDTVATAILWLHIMEKLKLGDTDLARFLVRQRQRALEQEVEFCRYVLEQGSGEREQPECPWHELEGLPLPEWPPRPPAMGTCPNCAAPAVFRIDKAGTVGLFNPDDSAHVCAGQ